MSINQENVILDTDINSIITTINNEISRRSAGSAIAKPDRYSKASASLPNNIVTALKNINAIHTYGATGGVFPTCNIVTHLGCPANTLTLTTTGFNFVSGSTNLYAVAPPSIGAINTDATKLAAQTQCANICANNCCNTVCTNACSCNPNCSCNGQCSNGCICNVNAYCTQTCINGCANNCCNLMCANGCLCNANCTNTTCTCEYV